MLTNVGLRVFLKSSTNIFRGSSSLSSAASLLPRRGPAALTPDSRGCCFPLAFNAPEGFAASQPVRQYARVAKTKKTDTGSQLSDLTPEMLKLDYAAVPLAQTTDDIVKRLLSLELASHSEKLQLKKEQLIAKVQRDETDRSSVEVQIAILTARIRNYGEHLQKHHKDKANKRRMLMAIDRRKKLLKNLRLVRYETFERVCEQLGITYTFPPEYYRRATRRWLAKKEFCIKVFKAVQKQKAEQNLKMKQNLKTTETEETKATAV
ncbi:28S ribosomal protein S15, mitochondrial [Oryzias latipes]|uniref:Small ribosomal subunit protein uS15m n=1 Tax=Oryzias latipes TaxID=8090 RepID=H2MHP5_ORYLA|nr:28S ribosomal protein S15, mitochondrial [Oryzias latipes]